MSTDRARPWWASDGPVDGGIDRDVDPIELHRAARRGREGPTAAGETADRGTDGPAGEDADTAAAAAAADAAGEHGPETCGVCPLCVGLRVLGEARPELVGHLTDAARSLTAAVRTLLEPPPADGNDGSTAPSGRRITRIDLD